MTDLRIGPFTDGIDTISRDVALRPSALRSCIDLDINRDGWLETRAGQTLASAVAGVHSLWSDGSTLYGAVGASLVRIASDYSRTTLLTLPSNGPVSFSVGPDRVYFTQSSMTGQITSAGARQVGVHDGSMVAVAAAASGGLRAGTYAVGLSYIGASGEEGSLSGLAYVRIAESGGLTLTLAWPADAASAWIYRTDANGDVLHKCATVPTGMTTYQIGVGDVSTTPSTQHLRRTPGGHIVRWWMGRLLIARGDTLWYSEPYRTHLCSPTRNFVRMPARLTMVEPVDGGVWVATARGVSFLAGTDPAQWNPKATKAAPPIPGCSAVVDPELFDGELGLGKSGTACWFGRRGFAFGTSSGQVIEPRAKTFSSGAAQRGSLVVHDRRLTAFLET